MYSSREVFAWDKSHASLGPESADTSVRFWPSTGHSTLGALMAYIPNLISKTYVEMYDFIEFQTF